MSVHSRKDFIALKELITGKQSLVYNYSTHTIYFVKPLIPYLW